MWYNGGVRRLSRHRTGFMESNETWKPIETAPKDREIWVCGLARVWVDSCLFVWQGHACWDEDKEGWITGGFDDSGDFLFVEATHWTEPRNLELPEHPLYDDPITDEPADCYNQLFSNVPVITSIDGMFSNAIPSEALEETIKLLKTD